MTKKEFIEMCIIMSELIATCVVSVFLMAAFC